MSREQQNAVLQECLDSSWLYRAFAALRNGLGVIPPRNVIQGEMHQPQENTPPAPQPVDLRTFATPMVPRPQRPSKLLRAARNLALIGTGLGAGWAVQSMLRPTDSSPPAAIGDGDDNRGPIGGDLLRELREQGYHLPPNE